MFSDSSNPLSGAAKINKPLRQADNRAAHRVHTVHLHGSNRIAELNKLSSTFPRFPRGSPAPSHPALAPSRRSAPSGYRDIDRAHFRSGNARRWTREPRGSRSGRFRCRMKINAAQFVCIINLQGALGRGGGRAGHRRYFKHSWLLCKIDRKFQLFPDKPVRATPELSVPGTHYPRINAITHVDPRRRRSQRRCHFSITGRANASNGNGNSNEIFNLLVNLRPLRGGPIGPERAITARRDQALRSRRRVSVIIFIATECCAQRRYARISLKREIVVSRLNVTVRSFGAAAVIAESNAVRPSRSTAFRAPTRPARC